MIEIFKFKNEANTFIVFQHPALFVDYAKENIVCHRPSFELYVEGTWMSTGQHFIGAFDLEEDSARIQTDEFYAMFRDECESFLNRSADQISYDDLSRLVFEGFDWRKGNFALGLTSGDRIVVFTHYKSDMYRVHFAELEPFGWLRVRNLRNRSDDSLSLQDLLVSNETMDSSAEPSQEDIIAAFEASCLSKYEEQELVNAAKEAEKMVYGEFDWDMDEDKMKEWILEQDKLEECAAELLNMDEPTRDTAKHVEDLKWDWKLPSTSSSEGNDDTIQSLDSYCTGDEMLLDNP